MAAYDVSYALKDYQISNTAKVIWGYLNGLAQASANKGLPYVYAGQKNIAERVGVTVRTVHNAMRQLQSAGLVKVRRRGQGLNNQTYVLSPVARELEKARDDRQSSGGSFQSGSEKNACPTIKAERVISNSIDYQSIPKNDNENAPTAQNLSGVTAKKNRPTNKRPLSKIAERSKRKAEYKRIMYQRLKVKEFKDSWWLYDVNIDDDIETLEKTIEIIANTAAGQGKIMVNGALLTPQAWWYCVQNITQDGVFEVVRRVNENFFVKNHKAYLLAALYNEGLQESLRA